MPTTRRIAIAPRSMDLRLLTWRPPKQRAGRRIISRRTIPSFSSPLTSCHRGRYPSSALPRARGFFLPAAPRGLRGQGNMARQVRQYFTGGDQRQFKVSGSKFKVNGQGKAVSKAGRPWRVPMLLGRTLLQPRTGRKTVAQDVSPGYPKRPRFLSPFCGAPAGRKTVAQDASMCLACGAGPYLTRRSAGPCAPRLRTRGG